MTHRVFEKLCQLNAPPYRDKWPARLHSGYMNASFWNMSGRLPVEEVVSAHPRRAPGGYAQELWAVVGTLSSLSGHGSASFRGIARDRVHGHRTTGDATGSESTIGRTLAAPPPALCSVANPSSRRVKHGVPQASFFDHKSLTYPMRVLIMHGCASWRTRKVMNSNRTAAG